MDLRPRDPLIVALLLTGWLTGWLVSCTPAIKKQDGKGTDLAEVFRTLHQPIHEVYGLRTSSQDRLPADPLHHLLAASFTGEALTRQYVEHFTSLARMARENTQIRIARVDYESVEVIQSATPKEPEHAVVNAQWSVGGVITHQGHRHVRTNRYRARFEMQLTDHGWRISESRLRDLFRVRTAADLGLGSSSEPGTSAGGLLSPLELLRAGLAEDLSATREAAEPADEGVDP